MKKYIYYFTISLALLFNSCEEFNGVKYNGEQTLAYFNTLTSTMEVELGSESSVDITVGASTLSDSDRTVAISIEESTTALTSQYSFPSEVVIPGGSYNTTFTVKGFDEDDLPTRGVNLVLKIETISDGGSPSPELHTLRIVKICPIPSDYMVGTYNMEVLQDDGIIGFPIIGPPNSNGTTEFVVGNSSTERSFGYEWAVGNGIFFDFTIQLSCNEIVVPDFQAGFCSGEPNIMGNPDGLPFGTYDLSDDSTFIVNFTANKTGDACNDGAKQTSVRFTKI